MENEPHKIIENLLNTTSSYAYGRPVAPISIAPFTYKEEKTEVLHKEQLALSQASITVGQTAVHTNIQQGSNHDSQAFAQTNQQKKKHASLQSIAEKVAQCTRCELHKNRTNTVCGVGVEKPLVLVIGEGPGQEEDKQGIPFVGPAGQLLDKMLGSIQLSRNVNCHIVNIVKCRPPHNRDPLPQEIQACASFLQAQIALLKPTMILAVGRVAAQNLLDTPTGISRLHGQFFNYPNTPHEGQESIPFMATYHPSALLRDQSYKKPAWEDLKKFKIKLEELCPNYTEAFYNQ